MPHYDQDYFDWQKNMGAFGGTASLFLFQPWIQPTDRVVDFGSGGGFLLANLNCHEKLGVELNDTARARAIENGIPTVKTSAEIPDAWADVIISHHCLEHTLRPLDEIQALHSKLKPGGKILFVTPYEKRCAYRPGDINQHLYTWSPMNLGNLFTLAGYHVECVEEIRHRWPPFFARVRQLLGDTLFHWSCRLWALWNPWHKPNFSNVRLIARK